MTNHFTLAAGCVLVALSAARAEATPPDVRNHVGQDHTIKELPGSFDTDWLVILGSTVVLDHAKILRSQLAAPANLAILAEEIRVRGSCYIDLTPYSDPIWNKESKAPKGGQIVLITDFLVIEDNSELWLDVNGAEGRPNGDDFVARAAGDIRIPDEEYPIGNSKMFRAWAEAWDKIHNRMEKLRVPPQHGGDGGAVIIAASRVEVAKGAKRREFGTRYVHDGSTRRFEPIVSGRSAAGQFFDKTVRITAKGGRGSVVRTWRDAERFSCGFSGFWVSEEGAVGNAGFITVSDGIREIAPHVPHSLVLTWRKAVLERHHQELLRAGQAGDLVELVKLAEATSATNLDGYGVTGDDRWIRMLEDLQDAYPEVSVGRIGAAGTGVQVALGRAVTGVMALPNRVRLRGVPVIQQSPRSVGRYLLSFDVALSLDSRSKLALDSELAERGLKSSGVFSAWRLTAPVLGTTEGVETYDIQQVGDTLRVELELDSDRAPLALSRLRTGEGIPVEFVYVCLDDPSVSGQISLPLTLVRTESPPLSLVEGVARNSGFRPLQIDFVVAGDRLVNLIPAPVVDPGGELPLPLPDGIETSSVSVPSDAVRELYLQDASFSLDGIRVVQGADAHVEIELHVQNLLRREHETYGSFEVVRLRVIYEVVRPGHTPLRVESGPYPLGPAGARDSSLSIRLLKPAAGEWRAWIEGTALYDGGRTTIPFESVASQDKLLYVDPRMIEPE